MEKLEYINNARVVDRLPNISDPHEVYGGSYCIELQIVDFCDNYIIYKATFCELDELPYLDEMRVNCFSYEYAIKNERMEQRKGYRMKKMGFSYFVERYGIIDYDGIKDYGWSDCARFDDEESANAYIRANENN